MNPVLARGLGRHLLPLLAVIALPGCAVVSVATTVASTAVSVAGTVVGTTVSVAGKVIEKVADVATSSDQP